MPNSERVWDRTWRSRAANSWMVRVSLLLVSPFSNDDDDDANDDANDDDATLNAICDANGRVGFLLLSLLIPKPNAEEVQVQSESSSSSSRHDGAAREIIVDGDVLRLSIGATLCYCYTAKEIRFLLIQI